MQLYQVAQGKIVWFGGKGVLWGREGKGGGVGGVQIKHSGSGEGGGRPDSTWKKIRKKLQDISLKAKKYNTARTAFLNGTGMLHTHIF